MPKASSIQHFTRSSTINIHELRYLGAKKAGKSGLRGEKCKFLSLKYFPKQEPRMLFDLHLASFEFSVPTSKRKFAIVLNL